MDNESSGSVWGSREKQELRSCLALGGRLFGRLGQAKEKSQLKSLNCSKMFALIPARGIAERSDRVPRQVRPQEEPGPGAAGAENEG